ncbi:MAG: hypothetical protein ABR579_02150 [Actinomycetota bacterium]
MNLSRRQLVAMIVGTATLSLAAPVAARTVVDFARNAGHVDGYSAVGSQASPSARGGQLVATNGGGHLPNNIIRKAPAAKEADKLQGHGAGAFVEVCQDAALLGKAVVPSDVGAGYEDVPGFQTQYGGAIDVDTGTACRVNPAAAKRVSVGVYQVRLATIIDGGACDSLPAKDGAALVTARSDDGASLIANYTPVCESGNVIEEVHIVDLNGTPTDATFDIALLNYGGVPIP